MGFVINWVLLPLSAVLLWPKQIAQLSSFTVAASNKALGQLFCKIQSLSLSLSTCLNHIKATINKYLYILLNRCQKMHLKETSPLRKLPRSVSTLPCLSLHKKGAKIYGGTLTQVEFVHSVFQKTEKALPCLTLCASNKQERRNTGWAFSMHDYNKYRH